MTTDRRGKAPGAGALAGIAGVVAAIAAGYLGVDALTGDNGTTPHTGDAAVSTTGYSCAVNTLPDQAEEVIDAILAGGPFDHGSDDGKHFGNYEGLLPKEGSSFYREYTVDTPGVKHRGVRRIVVGGGSTTDPEVWYYTGDHFDSFCTIPDAED